MRHVASGTGGIASGRKDLAGSSRLPNHTTVIERFDHSREFRSGGIRSWEFATRVKNGISATTGYCGDLCYVFSSNAYPFDPELAYSKFTAFALLNCGGDFIKAATMLACEGFVKAHQRQVANRYQGYQGYRGYHGYGGMKGVVSHR
jgi:hypothetical protein